MQFTPLARALSVCLFLCLSVHLSVLNFVSLFLSLFLFFFLSFDTFNRCSLPHPHFQIPEGEEETIFKVDCSKPSKSFTSGCIQQMSLMPLRAISAPDGDQVDGNLNENSNNNSMIKSNTSMELGKMPPPLPPKKKQSKHDFMNDHSIKHLFFCNLCIHSNFPLKIFFCLNPTFSHTSLLLGILSFHFVYLGLET